jgi:hypothetical protein
MNNRTTQRLVNRNVSRHFAVEQKTKEEYQPEKPLLTEVRERNYSNWAPWTGLVALIMQLLAMIGL